MRIYQSFSGEAQLAYLADNSIPFDYSDNNAPSTREYELFKKIYKSESLNEDKAPWGLLSWKFEIKSQIKLSEFTHFAEKSFAEGANCVFLNPMIGNEAIYANVWEQGVDCGHEGLDVVHNFLKNRGFSQSKEIDKTGFSFCNYFIGDDKFWSAYFAYIESVLHALEDEWIKHSEVGRVYGGPGNYRSDRSATMRIFIIERLFSEFVTKTSSIKFAKWQPSKEQFQAKFGQYLGEILWVLHKIKISTDAIGDIDNLEVWQAIRLDFQSSRNHSWFVWQLDDPIDFGMKDVFAATKSYANLLQKFSQDKLSPELYG